ncbi:hypothetical protein BDQ94DRAFT_144294 [Aspergillus welwitschiae]|uniref:Secreted protein n=1 Tax=Aspergillus welwitschiae TaxID=1341132 RepID=A0A3F3Q1B9_9EURO|nr:hypothetical protein BDQ94DRAFT_144294 [Aspergillus welwitschiae]RDH33014.1 hypothetical protein BDQ94DRAFT_144294 [Aspergillus welwitschiae]
MPLNFFLFLINFFFPPSLRFFACSVGLSTFPAVWSFCLSGSPSVIDLPGGSTTGGYSFSFFSSGICFFLPCNL